MRQGTVKMYQGRSITRLFASGYYEFYSRAEGRFLKFDTLAACKEAIREDNRTHNKP